jgi:hypothetical protein
MEQKDQIRVVDTTLYVVSLAYAAIRFSCGMKPFDFNDTAVAEYLVARSLPFIENPDISYKVAHENFLQTMLESGWEYGIEDFDNRSHPDLIPWSQLSKESKDLYGFTAGIISSAKDFLMELKMELESDILDSLSVFNGSTMMVSKTKTIIN